MLLEENGGSHRDQQFSDYIPYASMAPAEGISRVIRSVPAEVYQLL